MRIRSPRVASELDSTGLSQSSEKIERQHLPGKTFALSAVDPLGRNSFRSLPAFDLQLIPLTKGGHRVFAS
jgi:hypothetical protein